MWYFVVFYSLTINLNAYIADITIFIFAYSQQRHGQTLSNMVLTDRAFTIGISMAAFLAMLALLGVIGPSFSMRIFCGKHSRIVASPENLDIGMHSDIASS
jgi:hypothetical protein